MDNWDQQQSKYENDDLETSSTTYLGNSLALIVTSSGSDGVDVSPRDWKKENGQGKDEISIELGWCDCEI